MESEHPQRPAPVVLRTLGVIGAVVIAEPLSATILFPFVYFMIRDFKTVEEQDVGFWAGLITSAFFVPQMITATLWGVASDRWGRRPVMLFGLVGSSACMLLFGFSKSLAWAIASRGICGLFNGNAGVARTAVGELAHNADLNQAKAFSLFGFCSAIGYVIGPLIGGLLARPAERFSCKGPGDIFVEYPYLLPCMVSACYNVVVCATSWWLLEETNEIVMTFKAGTEIAPKPIPTDQEAGAEREPLIKPQGTERNRFCSKTATTCCIAGIVCISFHAIIFDETYAVFAATPNPAGLSFTSTDIAFSLSLMGPVILIAQLVLFPFLCRYFSALGLWRTSAAFFAAVYPMFSLLPQISESHEGRMRTAQWTLLLVLLGVRFATNVVAYTSMAVLLNQVALPANRGAVMGLGQTAISLGRAVGPAVGGSIWSWSLANGLGAPLDYHFLFLVELFLASAQAFSSIGIASKG